MNLPLAISDERGQALGRSDLERRFDERLTQPRVGASPAPALLDAAKRWSESVWARARAAGALNLADNELDAALRIYREPVFVCGVHRSGTTLMRDLLDGHPALAVLPSEGTFVMGFEPVLRQLPPERWLPYMGQEWLRRLANPNNQMPYWTLGRSSDERCPYTNFARALLAWWPITRAQLEHSVTSWPLVAVALAYVHATAGLANPRLRRWVEKTPTNERFIPRLLTEFPAAKIIQMVRHPAAVYASRKAVDPWRAIRIRRGWRVLKDLERTYSIAARYSREAAASHIVIRYEDLIADPMKCMDRVAEFLRIESLPILRQPTVAGQMSTSNSSAGANSQPGQVHALRASSVLNRADMARIAAIVGSGAAPLGYELASVGPLRASLLRLTARMLVGAT